MSDPQEQCQPPELQFLEMIRSLSARLPEHLVSYQFNACAEDLNNYYNFRETVLDVGESLAFSDAALSILFHHIAFETFAAFEKLQAKTSDEDSDEPNFSDIESPAVRNFWHRFVEQRKASREARAQEILGGLTEEDRTALIEAGVRFPRAAKVKPTSRRFHR